MTDQISSSEFDESALSVIQSANRYYQEVTGKQERGRFVAE
jgi:hypothetical protein